MAKKLLLVEDNLSIQHVVQTLFQANDFEVVVTGEAAAALHTIETWHPDIVLADAAMPDIDGFQLCQIIRNIASLRHIPVLLLSSRFMAYDTAKGERVGVTAHVPKPFEPQVLFDLVQQLLAPATPILPRGTTPGPTVAASMLSHEEASSVPQAARGNEELEMSRAADMAQHSETQAMAHVALAAAPEAVYASLGRDILQMLHQTLEAQMADLLAKITPQIVEAVRDAVLAQAPALLEMLLQREIEKLKQTVDHEDTWSLKP
jgi:CheY-like chemotaxis protein